MQFKIQLLSIIILLLSAISRFTASDNFEKHFKKVKTIQLSSEVLIGEIAYLDVDEQGNILITDVIGKNVLIFNPDGKLKSKLSAEPCHPGFTFNPLKAKFSPKGTILLINSIPWGFRFKNNGECLGKVDKTFTAPVEFTFNNGGNIYGYYQGYDGNYLCKMDSLGKEIKRFGNFPKYFKNLLYRLEGGGIVNDQHGNIYYANPIEPKIYKYNQKLELIATFKNEPSYHRMVQKDLSEKHASQNLLFELGKVMKGKTLTQSLYLLDTDKILVQYIMPGKCGVDIFDLSGKLLTDEIIAPELIQCAKYGKIFIVRESESDDLNNVANPLIEVYKFKFE